ncbi:MAG: hypothetical protein P8182_04640 [Deltaproteobacteria bacterium]
MQKEFMAVYDAVTMHPDHLTTEKLEGNLGGFGSFNLAIWAATNIIAEEMQRGRKMKLDVANEAYTDVDEIARKVTSFLQTYGADPSNSSVVTAALLYWAGVNASAGIPTPNRKLGGVCRIAAGAPGGRVSTLPTEKLNNKISGFAAVLAIYEALQKEHLAPFDPTLLPVGLAGSPVLGHSALGEDYLFPTLVKKLVPIGVNAMLKAYRSVGIKPCRFMAALFSTAATLEILHPDAYLGEEYGPFLRTRTPDLCGQVAVEAAGLPEVLHVRGTGDELKTAKVVGDLGLVLKDAGAPTVVGMIMFNEVNAIIQEGPIVGVGRGGGPILLPLHHWVTQPSLVLYALGHGASEDEAVDILKRSIDGYFQREDANIAINLLAHRARQLKRGPVSDVLIKATEPGKVKTLSNRIGNTLKKFEDGLGLADVVDTVEKEHISTTQLGVAKIMSNILGKNVEYVKYENVRPCSGRRKAKIAQKFFAFDGHVDIEVKVDGKVYTYDNFLANWAPKIMMEADEENLPGMAAVCLGVTDLLNSGACSANMVICACVAVAMGMDPKEAADKVAEYSNFQLSIPAQSLYDSAEYTARILKEME